MILGLKNEEEDSMNVTISHSPPCLLATSAVRLIPNSSNTFSGDKI